MENNNNTDRHEDYNNSNMDHSDYWYYIPIENEYNTDNNEDIDYDNEDNDDDEEFDDDDDDDGDDDDNEFNENNNNINIIIGSNVSISDQSNINIVNIVVNTLLGINVVESMNFITNKMHRIDIQKDNDNDNFVLNGDTCSVCLDEYNGNIMMLKECKHIFHENCAKAWFRDQRTCPLCRTVCYHASIIKTDKNECNKNANELVNGTK
ncbi:ubitquitin ligase RING1-like protein [Malacosoma neustria nucleopolyhedrovirus]|uniref:ubitquitin ligase RING1-like protein n=1 Tax=Malacosoma neustria nuclear polyhedrosis virus TaxID=38012 RepID=UPI000E35EF34|nr:ubitquitin ligase RING1-like protein [Malacosoma neustria nucleopolyhedrovirus]AUF81597.1 ubitquitin ligase RING1-like protein [Malacosoma neustria nucleopolyhedrovirus]